MYIFNNQFTSDICTHQLISRLPTNWFVVEASIYYVEHVYQTLTFSHHVLHEERHLGNFLYVFTHKKESYDNPARATPYSAELQKVAKTDKTQFHKPCASEPDMGPKPQKLLV